MDAIILAGGRGTRLKSVVSDVPKPLAPIRNHPFLDYLIRQLDGNVKRIILAVGYKAEQIKTRYYNNHFLFSEEDRPLGTGGALKQALTLTKSSPVLVLNGDSYFDIDFEKMYSFHQQNHAHLTLACREEKNVSRYGSIFFHHTQRVQAFREKYTQDGKGWVNGGIYLMDKELLSPFSKTIFSLEEDAFPSLLKKQVFAYLSSGKFIDIGTKESYLQAQDIL